MSLFPAYSAPDTAEEDEDEHKDKEWLYNSSYNFASLSSVQITEPENSGRADSSSDDEKPEKKLRVKHKKTEKHKKRKRKKKEAKSQSPVRELISDDCDLYCIDRTKRLHYVHQTTLNKSIKPRCHVNIKAYLGPYCDFHKKEKTPRYFIQLKELMKGIQTTAEDELLITKKAEEYNKNLCGDSSVHEWIEFVEFQNEFFRSQHISYNTESERKRAILQKKLSILEKALSHNPKNEELIKYWLKVGLEVLPPEELLNKTQYMLECSPESISLWLNLISVRQQSLALSTFPSVTALYRKAINVTRKIKTDEAVDRDKNVLELLFHYCRYLEHCGHWETLWTIIKNNFYLNFGKELNVDVNVEDERIKNLEDEIISNNQQPIWVMWKRVEMLREGLHFLPVSESLDYPQRCVSTEDVIDFIVRFHNDVRLRLIIMTLMLLKVPLLPVTTCVLQELFRNRLPWILDSPELMLSSVFISPAASVKVNYLRRLTDVTSGPQYLRNEEGQPEFLEFVQRTFQECMKFLDGKEKMFLGLWWLRFNRWLCILDKYSLAKLHFPAKKMKNLFKDFMKNEENRNNLLFYCEYSLFEYYQGNIESCIKTLKTLILSRGTLYQLTNELEKAALCHVYKCLCEIYVATGQIGKAVKLIANFGRGTNIDSDVGNDSIKVSLHKLEHVAYEIIFDIRHPDESESSPSLEQFFVPQYSVECLSCYMWLIALTQPTAHLKTYVEEVCSKLKDCESKFATYVRESLYEVMTVIFYALEKNNLMSISHVTKDGLQQFPFNLTILSVLASAKLDDHGLWWTFKQSFLSPPTIFGCTALICVALQRHESDKESLFNRMKSLFQHITVEDGRLCSIIHCLRLKFLFEFDCTGLEVAHINAIEACPWNKRVFMAAISALPNKLMELTDVLIEKEMRIHITPDEIQEIRD